MKSSWLYSGKTHSRWHSTLINYYLLLIIAIVVHYVLVVVLNFVLASVDDDAATETPIVIPDSNYLAGGYCLLRLIEDNRERATVAPPDHTSDVYHPVSKHHSSMITLFTVDPVRRRVRPNPIPTLGMHLGRPKGGVIGSFS